MSFTQTQVRRLRAKLKPQHIKTRDADGVSLSYVEGWHVVAEANRIFGFEGWDRETVSSDCVWTKQVNGRYCAAYVTRIRIRVRAGEAVIIREGSGAGESSANSPGQAHEFAAKAAETDATKRALMTFGNAFGLSLYGGATDAKAKAAAPIVSGVAEQEAHDVETDREAEAQAPDETATVQAGAITMPAETVVAANQPRPEVLQHVLPVNLPEPGWPHIAPLDEAVRLDQERQERIDKSALLLSEPRRIRDLGHLAFVASKPCLVCGRNRAHAHHLKFAQPTALARKVSDEFTVPLCSTHHRELHRSGNEREWWGSRGIDALQVAKELWSARQGSGAGMKMV